MGGLVGIDVGVLDDDLLAGDEGPGSAFAAQQRGAVGAAVEPDVDVAVAGHLHGGHAGDGADFADQFGGDLPGRLAQLFGQLEGAGDGHFAEIALPRLLDGDRQVDAVAGLICARKALETCFSMEWNTGNYEYRRRRR